MKIKSKLHQQLLDATLMGWIQEIDLISVPTHYCFNPYPNELKTSLFIIIPYLK